MTSLQLSTTLQTNMFLWLQALLGRRCFNTVPSVCQSASVTGGYAFVCAAAHEPLKAARLLICNLQKPDQPFQLFSLLVDQVYEPFASCSHVFMCP